MESLKHERLSSSEDGYVVVPSRAFFCYITIGLVAYTQTAWPDMLMGLIIATVVVHSALKIIHEATTTKTHLKNG